MKESQLIFLISQPRSGSSMLQQLLLSSEKIVSKPEPWFMLSLINTYKENDTECGYNYFYAYKNFINYINHSEAGIDFLKSKIKELALDLYALSVQDNNTATYFLDKTPRYYHIVNELIDLFPDAKFIFLSRNPVAVFSSILHYNFNGNIKAMFKNDRIHDLYTAIDIISEFKQKKIKNTFFVNYENIIKKVESELKSLFDFLNLSYPEHIGRYNVSKDFAESFAVDKKSLNKHSEPVSDYLNNWKKYINTYEKKKILLEYIKSLDGDKVNILGYTNIEDEVNKIKVKKTYLNPPLAYYTKFNNSVKYQLMIKFRNLIYGKKNNS